jgi:hypothetical protein
MYIFTCTKWIIQLKKTKKLEDCVQDTRVPLLLDKVNKGIKL